MILPVLAGVGALALLLGGAEKDKAPNLEPSGDVKTPETKKKAAVKKAVDAVKREDWQAAVVAVLESGSASAVGKLAIRLRAAGKEKEAVALLRAFRELQELARDPEEVPDPEIPLGTPEPEPEDDDDDEPEDDDDDEPEPEDDDDDEPGPEPLQRDVLARDVAAMLRSSSRYREDRAAVEKWQRKIGVKQDGIYGPGTARTLWTKGNIVPPNPFYFSKRKASAIAQAREFKKWLAALAVKLKNQGRLEEAQQAESQLATVGR